MFRLNVLLRTFAVFIFLAGLAQAQYQTPADLILHNGKIITVDDHGFTSRLGTIARDTAPPGISVCALSWRRCRGRNPSERVRRR